TEEF
ncbi:hypothetical protein D041_0524B, partial [Vibrio parahaemolyticus EKP-008]